MSQVILLILCHFLSVLDAKADTSPAPLKLIFFSDVHAKPGERITAELKKAAMAINHETPQLLIGGGDLVDLCNVSDLDSAWNTYSVFRNLLLAPVIETAGNRDIYCASDTERARSKFLSATGNRGIPSYIFYNGYHFLLLDSVKPSSLPPGYVGEIGHEQAQWIRQTIATIPKSAPIILVTHIPFMTDYLPGSRGTPPAADKVLVDGPDILALFSKHSLLLVLQGHSHIYEKLEHGNSTFITGGSLIGAGWNGKNAGTSPGFVIVEINGEEVKSRYTTVSIFTPQ